MIINIQSFCAPKEPCFIVIDGLNGAGKSTLQEQMVRYLEACGVPALSTFEPGATRIGKTIRALLLDTESSRPGALTELFLFAADRTEHIEKVICPALKEGKLVISDRFYYSTTAFQGYGRGIDLKIISQINEIAVSNLHPDMVFLLDIDPKIAIQRTLTRNSVSSQKQTDAFEEENMSFHQRLRHGFLEIARESPSPFVVLDAHRGPEEIFDDTRKILDKIIKANKGARL